MVELSKDDEIYIEYSAKDIREAYQLILESVQDNSKVDLEGLLDALRLMRRAIEGMKKLEPLVRISKSQREKQTK